MKICVLGSSSGGNATYLEMEGVKIIVDAGLSAKIIKERLCRLGVDLNDIDGIFITHEHTDHINGLKGLIKDFPRQVYCTRHTAQAIENNLDISPDFCIFSSGEAFSFKGIKIEPIPVFHDAQDPVGFCFYTSYGKLGLVGDLGHVTAVVKQKLEGVNILIIESNHDPKMLMADMKRPMSVKMRIRGRQGHLSNEVACKLVEEISHSGLYHVLLYHLSQDCNCPNKALEMMRDTLKNKGYCHISVHLTYPDKMSEIIMHPLLADITENDSNLAFLQGFKGYSYDQLEIPMA